MQTSAHALRSVSQRLVPLIAHDRASFGAINVGSGANNATAPSIPLVTRNTIANDASCPR